MFLRTLFIALAITGLSLITQLPSSPEAQAKNIPMPIGTAKLTDCVHYWVDTYLEGVHVLIEYDCNGDIITIIPFRD